MNLFANELDLLFTVVHTRSGYTGSWLASLSTVSISAYIAYCTHFTQNPLINTESCLLSLVGRMPWDAKWTYFACLARKPVSVGFGPIEWNAGWGLIRPKDTPECKYTSGLRWKLFQKCCVLYHLDPVHYNVPTSDFLHRLLDSGLSLFTLSTNHCVSLAAH